MKFKGMRDRATEPLVDPERLRAYLEAQVVRVERLSYNSDAVRRASRGARPLWVDFAHRLTPGQRARLRQVIDFGRTWAGTGVEFLDFTPTPCAL